MATTPAALQKQRAVIPLVDGLDLKTAEGAAQPLKLLELQNADLSEPGIIKKDWGYIAASTAEPDATAMATPLNRVIGDGRSQLVFAGSRRYFRIPGKETLQQDLRTVTGTVEGVVGPPCTTSSEIVQSLLSGSPRVDYAITDNGAYEMVLQDNSFWLRERETGATVLSAGVSSTANGWAQCVNVGNVLILVWINAADLKCKIFDTSTAMATVPADVTIASDVDAQKFLDVCANASNFWVAYHSGGAVKVARCTTAGAINASATTAGTPNSAICVAVSLDGTDVLVGWCDTATGVHFAGFSAACVAVSAYIENAAATAVYRMTIADCASGGANAYAFYEDRTGGLNVVRRNTILWDGSASVGTRATLYGHQLYHKAFHKSGGVFVGVFYERADNEMARTVFCDPSAVATVDPVATYLPFSANDAPDQNAISAVAYDSVTGNYRFCAVQNLPSDVGVLTAVHLLSMRLWDCCPVRIGESLVLSGGVDISPSSDFYSVAGPVGFAFAPVITSAVASNGAGALTPSTTYQIVAVYESIDGQGNIYRSIPSEPAQVAMGVADDTITLAVTNSLERARPFVKTRIYSTVGDGTILHDTGSTTQNTARDALTTSIVLLSADSTINTRAILYTAGDALPNYAPPFGASWCVHQDRVFAVNRETGEVWHSKELVRGEGPAFHPNLVIDCRTDGIEPHVVVSSASGLWVFGKDRISDRGAIGLVVGDGPNDQGNGSSYTLQRLDGCVVGTTSHRSTVQCPIGIMFVDAQHGIHVLPNGGGAPQYIGAPIERDFDGETVVCATLMEDRKEVRFCCTSGLIFVYNYERGLWSTRPLESGSNGIVDACVWDGKHVLATDDDRILVHGDITGAYANAYRELSWGSYAYLPLRISTAWIKLDDFSGLTRIWDLYLLGKYYAAHSLTVTVAYDFDDADADEYAFSQADIASVATAGVYEVRVHLRRQKARAIRITIEDDAETEQGEGGAVATSATGEGFGLYAIRMHYGTLGRASKLPSYAAKG